MKTWIGMLTAVVCSLPSSMIYADDAAESVTVELAQESSPPEGSLPMNTPLADQEASPAQTGPQAGQVGKASADSANTGKANNVAKYVLAGSAVAVGIIAIILVSRHHGHHHGHH